MTLARRIREALERAGSREAALLAGDAPEEEPGAPLTPAAVLVPVVDRPEPGVLLTLRPHNMRRHAGQISFPGGRIDPGDDGPVAAALREAEEEIGLARNRVEVIGTGDRYRTITGFDVTPVLGVVPPDLPLTPSANEVAELFEAPLRILLDPDRQRVQTVNWQGQMRTYYEIEVDGRRIWGATAAMIVNLSRRLELSW